jgi:hypothetical protein
MPHYRLKKIGSAFQNCKISRNKQLLMSFHLTFLLELLLWINYDGVLVVSIYKKSLIALPPRGIGNRVWLASLPTILFLKDGTVNNEAYDIAQSKNISKQERALTIV